MAIDISAQTEDALLVASCTIAELFSGNGIEAQNYGSMIEGKLTIPEYQRAYQWSEKEISLLLDDYITHRSNAPELPFYLGSIILHQSKRYRNKPILNIIDGQQRLTTMAIFAYLLDDYSKIDLRYESPVSQACIRRNLTSLKTEVRLKQIDFSSIVVTLVVTQSEDDAYRFFETQNTGGVRLGGPDIIKAHHLRAIDQWRDQYAQLWESLGDLNPVVNALLKGRYWEHINFRNLPSHREPQEVRRVIVTELAEDTSVVNKMDVGYGRFSRVRSVDGGEILQHHQNGYEMRQPLNTGINTINYLVYFENLRKNYLIKPNSHVDLDFVDFYQKFICSLQRCEFLKDLYVTCLLLFISQFGAKKIYIAAVKLFRVVYSPRVTNQKAVKESSIGAFVRDNPVLDWILSSYTEQQCFAKLDAFKLNVDPNNLGVKDNSAKKAFVKNTLEHFQLDLSQDKWAESFGSVFSQYIKNVQRPFDE